MHLGVTEMVVVLGLALLFFGPTRLPGLGSALGSAVRSFKRGLSGQEDEANKPALPASQNQQPPQA